MAGLVVLVGLALVVAGSWLIWGPGVACLTAGALLLAPTALRTTGAALRRPGGNS